MVEATRFLNVDLDVSAPHDLGPLVTALDALGAFCLHSEHHEGEWSACFELADCFETANSAVLELARRVRCLPSEARAVWNEARVRDFNVGIQAGLEPHCRVSLVREILIPSKPGHDEVIGLEPMTHLKLGVGGVPGCRS